MSPVSDAVTVDAVETPVNSVENAVETAEVAAPTEFACSVDGAVKPASEFSILLNGTRSPVCKRCRADKANAWTAARADYRKVFHTALRAKNTLGLNVIMPVAKTWQAGDVTMLADGRTLDSVLTELAQTRADGRAAAAAVRAASAAQTKAEKLAARELKQAEREALALTAAGLRADAKAEREALRAEKLANAEANKATKAAAKAEKLAARQALAETARAEKLAEREARKAASAAAAEVARQERETLKAEKAAQREVARAAALANKPARQPRQPKVIAAAAGSSEIVADTAPLSTEEAVETLEQIQETSNEPIQNSALGTLKSFFGLRS